VAAPSTQARSLPALSQAELISSGKGLYGVAEDDDDEEEEDELETDGDGEGSDNEAAAPDIPPTAADSESEEGSSISVDEEVDEPLAPPPIPRLDQVKINNEHKRRKATQRKPSKRRQTQQSATSEDENDVEPQIPARSFQVSGSVRRSST